MPVINPYLGFWNFEKKITSLVETGTASREAVIQAFHELKDDYIPKAIGLVLMETSGKIIEAVDFPYSPISSSRFANDRICPLYSEVLANAQPTLRGELESIIYTFTDFYLTIMPLAVEDCCLIVLDKR